MCDKLSVLLYGGLSLEAGIDSQLILKSVMFSSVLQLLSSLIRFPVYLL